MSDPLFYFCCDAVNPFYIKSFGQGYEEKVNMFMDWAECPLESFDEKNVWEAMQGPWPFAVELIKYVRYDITPSRWFLARKDTKDFFEVDEDDIRRENDDSDDVPDQAA
ncbi:hypothetical protein E4U17_002839 [Claviceps sp. LM77 group G4]|nr:hypothetical protein E4U17_002839 [Claviceps sp. LM77 group G4]KAG6069721.1 hypothetical protein E4U33_004650 [Claviceps sp. LM78 group G4]KAG6076075.1 hypothetical protein E4U16_002995 [Claviceps sp. LM84 group G4]